MAQRQESWGYTIVEPAVTGEKCIDSPHPPIVCDRSLFVATSVNLISLSVGITIFFPCRYTQAPPVPSQFYVAYCHRCQSPTIALILLAYLRYRSNFFFRHIFFYGDVDLLVASMEQELSNYSISVPSSSYQNDLEVPHQHFTFFVHNFSLPGSHQYLLPALGM